MTDFRLLEIDYETPPVSGDLPVFNGTAFAPLSIVDLLASSDINVNTLTANEVFSSYFNYDGASETYFGNPSNYSFLYGSNVVVQAADTIDINAINSSLNIHTDADYLSISSAADLNLSGENINFTAGAGISLFTNNGDITVGSAFGTNIPGDNTTFLAGDNSTVRATLDGSSLTLEEVSLVVNYSGGLNALAVTGTNFTRFAVDNTTATTGGGTYGIASMSILSESGKRYFQSACYCSAGNGSRYGLSLNGMAEHVAVENTGGGLTSFVIGTYNSSAPVVFVSNQVERFRIPSTGGLTFVDANNFTFGTSSGTKIGTATSQKIGFWNATPIIQVTTGVAAATFVVGAGTAVNDASTFDGYTLKQVVKALRNIGLLA